MDETTGARKAPVVFEGYELPPTMTAEDIQAILGGTVSRRTVVRWCKKRIIRATKVGKTWFVRGSHFVEDWEAIERAIPRAARTHAMQRTAKGSIRPSISRLTVTPLGIAEVRS